MMILNEWKRKYENYRPRKKEGILKWILNEKESKKTKNHAIREVFFMIIFNEISRRITKHREKEMILGES